VRLRYYPGARYWQFFTAVYPFELIGSWGKPDSLSRSPWQDSCFGRPTLVDRDLEADEVVECTRASRTDSAPTRHRVAPVLLRAAGESTLQGSNHGPKSRLPREYFSPRRDVPKTGVRTTYTGYMMWLTKIVSPCE
jgi:hypothetical protein